MNQLKIIVPKKNYNFPLIPIFKSGSYHHTLLNQDLYLLFKTLILPISAFDRNFHAPLTAYKGTRAKKNRAQKLHQKLLTLAHFFRLKNRLLLSKYPKSQYTRIDF